MLIVRKAVCAMTLAMASVTALCAQSSTTTTCGTEVQEKQKENALRATAMEVFEAIRVKDTAAFVSHVSRFGLAVGGDVAQTPLGEIERKIHRKQGIYCLLFSTACLSSTKFPPDPDVDLSKWRISFSEWLNSNRPLKIGVVMIDTGGVDYCGGDVSVYARRKSPSAPGVLEMGFVYEDGKWVVYHIPAFP